ncbi:MAG TPA: sigma factor, partial [Armatimonadota bacterium]|nr:sigma factor [Armatimonadota bacterium]
MATRRKGGVAEWTDEETEQLFRQYTMTRDPAIRDQLVMMHQNLVRFLAGKFANRGEALEDLVQVGVIGLINAIDRFDPDRGTKFST